MGLINKKCDDCGTRSYVDSLSVLRQSGWSYEEQGKDSRSGWRCEFCNGTIASLDRAREQEAAVHEAARQEAYDLETIARLTTLVAKLEEAGRLAWAVRMSTVEIAALVSYALEQPKRDNVGAWLDVELAAPTTDDAL